MSKQLDVSTGRRSGNDDFVNVIAAIQELIHAAEFNRVSNVKMDSTYFETFFKRAGRLIKPVAETQTVDTPNKK